MKIPDNPWSRYGITDYKWRIIYIVFQIILIAGCAMMVGGMFIGDDNQYIHDIGSFIFTLGIWGGIDSRKSNGR